MKMKFPIIAASLIFLCLHHPAYAYLDPGTGSVIIQGILAGLAMAAMAIKMYWQRLVNGFNNIFRRSKPEIIEQEDA